MSRAWLPNDGLDGLELRRPGPALYGDEPLAMPAEDALLVCGGSSGGSPIDGGCSTAGAGSGHRARWAARRPWQGGMWCGAVRWVVAECCCVACWRAAAAVMVMRPPGVFSGSGSGVDPSVSVQSASPMQRITAPRIDRCHSAQCDFSPAQQPPHSRCISVP